MTLYCVRSHLLKHSVTCNRGSSKIRVFIPDKIVILGCTINGICSKRRSNNEIDNSVVQLDIEPGFSVCQIMVMTIVDGRGSRIKDYSRNVF